MAGESVIENIYLAIAFACGGQKRFHKPPLAVAERCAQLISTGCQRSRFYKSGFLINHSVTVTKSVEKSV
jgi:hypothetical protein